MKASMFLAATGAALAVAGPIRMPLDKRAMQTDWVTAVVTVTVTAGQEPTSTSISSAAPTTTAPVVAAEKSKPRPKAPAPIITTVVVPQSSAAPEPAPQPEPSSEPQPEPSSEPAPEPVPEPEPTTTEAAPVETTQAAPTEPDTDSYEGLMLHHHNIHRANHSAPDLSWDATLAGYAKTIAEGCVFQHDMNQGDGGYGQNLASWGASGDISSLQDKSAASAITEQWYNGEVNSWQFYGMDDPPASSPLTAWGHFTQVVWKSSTKVGCYTANCPAGTVLAYPSWYTVCNYNPPGNFGGEYGANVLEPKGLATVNV